MWEKWLKRVDDLQRRHRPTAIAVAVFRKYSDDKAGRLAAAIAYYGFFSLFPLLLVFTTVVGWVLADHPDWQQSLADSAVAEFPIVGEQIAQNVGQINGSGLAFVVGLVLALWAGLGAAQALQDALNDVWSVAPEQRPSAVTSRLRSLGAVAILGLGVVATTVIGVLLTANLSGLLASLTTFLTTALVSLGLFVALFRVLSARSDMKGRSVWPGAFFAATGWSLLQTVGVALLDRQLRQASALYGFFGLVIGLLWWIYLQALITLVAAELNVVIRDRLWPRDLVQS